MKRRAEQLTALEVTRLSRKGEPGLFSDGANLYLQVTPSGVASWVFRYLSAGRERAAGLGPLHTVSLKEAREKALESRKLRLDGIDPLEHRRAARTKAALDAARVMSFRRCAEAYIEAKRDEWTNAKPAAQWQAPLSNTPIRSWVRCRWRRSTPISSSRRSNRIGEASAKRSTGCAGESKRCSIGRRCASPHRREPGAVERTPRARLRRQGRRRAPCRTAGRPLGPIAMQRVLRRRTTAWLATQGHRVNRKRVRRLMRLLGLAAIYQRPNTSKPAPAHKIYPYLLGGLAIERVNQVWCSDVTYIPMAKGFLAFSTW